MKGKGKYRYFGRIIIFEPVLFYRERGIIGDLTANV